MNNKNPQNNKDFRVIVEKVRHIDRKTLEDGLKEFLWLVPNIVKLLGRLIANPGVSTANKLLLGLGVTYVLSPIDIIPDFIPVLGQLDDLAIVGLLLGKLIAESDGDIIHECWDGDVTVIDGIFNLCQSVNSLIKSKISL